ncbi:hypothetical protein G9A89_022794 [Geosiphon pyriformis]|nr:hypothetical protein G9A89_022794 [Geosiphon pyriformis]
MVYAPIAKLDNFTSKEDDTQIWLNDIKKAIVANRWNNSRTLQAILYFLKDTANSWDTEVVTTYLGRFHRNLRQIQAIQVNYFTTPQILNQFIRGLHSSILQDFEAAELEANHVQAVNLVINKSSDLDSKLKQFSDTINQKLEGYLANNHAIYQPSQ